MTAGETRALAAARDSGLLERGRPLLVLISAGADSTCLLDVARRLGADVGALHVNYGLRPESDADEAHCRSLCEQLGVPLTVERVELPSGTNLQAAAREARYRLAERAAIAEYAAGHTADDQAETVVYRLATSPGRRSLLGMRPRRGRLVRPLLRATRDDTRAHCAAAGLEWREDSSNSDPRFARARIRHEVLPALAPQAAHNIVTTSELLRAEAELLDTLVAAALDALGERPHVERLRELDPALARLALIELAERAGAPAPPADAIGRLLAAGDAGTRSFDVGAGVRAVVEYGRIRFARAHVREGDAPQQAVLRIPGSATFGAYELVASARAGKGDVMLDRGALGDALVVRAWQPGDRMRPAGLGGTRKLQDLFTDRKVPREARHAIPVVVACDEIAWVPGVAVGERFRAGAGRPAVALSARSRADERPPPPPRE